MVIAVCEYRRRTQRQVVNTLTPNDYPKSPKVLTL